MAFRIIRRLILPYVLISVLVFYVLFNYLNPDTLIMFLNSLFIGTMVSISVTYGYILIPAIVGRQKYDDVRVYAVGIFAGWLAYGLLVLTSIYVRAADLPSNTLILVSISRWIAINAAIIQIIAPDFNQDRSFVYGRDRKLLIAGLFVGLAFSAFSYYIQAEEVLAP